MSEVIELYRRNAVAFDRDRNRDLFERSYLDTIVRELPGGANALDLGCGSGEPIAGYLISAGLHITGVDGAAAMLDLCRVRFPEMAWIEADMRTLQLAKRFDAILAWNSFFHLTADDQRAMFPVFAEHAAPGCLLLFTSGHEAGEVWGTVAGEAVYHASLAPEEYRALLTENGFEVLSYRAQDPDCALHTVWLARYRQSEA